MDIYRKLRITKQLVGENVARAVSKYKYIWEFLRMKRIGRVDNRGYRFLYTILWYPLSRKCFHVVFYIFSR